MKTKNSSWKSIIVILSFSVITAFGFLISCEKENIQPLNEQLVKTDQSDPQDILPLAEVCGSVLEKNLLLTDERTAGSVYVYNDTKYFYIHVIAPKDYAYKNAYLYLGLEEDIPMTVYKNLDYKRFNYKIESRTLSRARRFKIPLSEIHTKFTVSMMVQTRFGRQELMVLRNAWVDGELVGTTDFGRIFKYKKEFCAVNDPAELP